MQGQKHFCCLITCFFFVSFFYLSRRLLYDFFWLLFYFFYVDLSGDPECYNWFARLKGNAHHSLSTMPCTECMWEHNAVRLMLNQHITLFLTITPSTNKGTHCVNQHSNKNWTTLKTDCITTESLLEVRLLGSNHWKNHQQCFPCV